MPAPLTPVRGGARPGRRRFLVALAVVPALPALTRCAARRMPPEPCEPAVAPPPPAAHRTPEDAPFAAVREHPLPDDAEPAFTFRALVPPAR